METTPTSTQARYVSQGCQKHTKLRHRPLQFVYDFKSGQHSVHSNTSLTSLFEESSLCSSLGEVDTSWFDSERWTSNDETKWKKEDILKTPQASQRENKACSTPGLFTPDGLSPVARRGHKDYPDCHPLPDDESASSFLRPKRFRKVPSSIHTTPNSQIITSHQPTSGPTAETIEEEEEDKGEVAQSADIQFSPYPTWNPTFHKDTPVFMKQLFKTPSTLFGAGDKRACSTPLQRLSTPQRLSRSLGAEPEESDLSWTSSLATPPMSSKGCKTVTSSTKKVIEDDSWQTHDVAKVLFQDGGSVVEMDSSEEGDEGLTQPLQVIKLPSITDESQEEEFTIETEDGGESDKSIADGSKAIAALGNEQCSRFDVVGDATSPDNLKNDQAGTRTGTDNSLIPPTTSVQSSTTDNRKPHLAKDEEHESFSECAVPDQYMEEKSSVREKVEDMDNAAELKSRTIANGECTDTNVPSKLAHGSHSMKNHLHVPIQPAMSSQQSSIIGSSQTLFNSQESIKNEKSAIEETLAFLLATPPSRREKLLNRLGASSSGVGETTTFEKAACDAAGSTLDRRSDSPVTGNSVPKKSISDDTLMSPPVGILWKQTISGHLSGGPERNSLESECSVDAKTNGQVGETPNRPAPDVDMLSPISPNFAEALCRVTDIASREQPSGNKSTLTVQKCLEVERNLIGDFDSPDSDTTRSPIKVVDQSRSEDCTDIVVKKTLHPTETTGKNAIAVHLSAPITSSLPSSANNKLPKHLSKQETSPVVPPSRSLAISNLNTQTAAKGRFKYTAAVPRKDGASTSKTPSWLSRAVYVEEDEEEDKTAGAVQADTIKDESSKKPWTMKRPCRTATTFKTFSTFCKTAPNPPSTCSTQSQTGLRTSTTPTSSRSIVQSAPPHNKTLVRIREIPHSWPSPKRLRLDEEREECPIGSDLKSLSSAVEEHDGEITKSTPLESDVKLHHVQDLVKGEEVTEQKGLGDFHDKVNSSDHAPSSEGDLHQMAPNVGFSSASGKAIFVSPEALKKAERLLEDVDREKPPEEFQLNLSSVDHQCGFQSASGKSIAVSDAALSKAKKIIAEVDSHDEEIDDSSEKQQISLGFTSAGGSVINISAAAMAKARKIMKEINQDEESNPTLHERKDGQTYAKHHVDGGGDGSRIHNEEVVDKVSLPGHASPRGKADGRQRHKGFRPFKPPCLVANIQIPSNLPSPTSISSMNQNSAIDVIKESERGESLEMYKDSVPDDLQTPFKQGNAVMPELQSTTLQHEQKIETSQSSIILEQTQDNRENTDSMNGQPVDNGELEISEDECLSTSQAAREIKAAEEMELVYNFMQEEDTGFSQLDVSSIVAADRTEKGAAQILKWTDKHRNPIQKEGGHASNCYEHQEMSHHVIEPAQTQDFSNEHIGHFIVPEDQHQRDAPIGITRESTNRNEESPAGNLHKESQHGVAFVQSHSLSRSCGPEQNLPSPKCARKETQDIYYLRPTEEDDTHETEAPVADLSMNTVRQLMDDSSILIEESDRVGTLSRKHEVQKEQISQVDSHTAYQGNADSTIVFKTAQGQRDEPGSRMDDNNVGGHDPVGFKTAGGKKIQVSKSALQKATLLLSDCNSDVGTLKGSSLEISDKLLNQLIPTSSAQDICISDATTLAENVELCKSEDQNAKASECIPPGDVLQREGMITHINSGCPVIRNDSTSVDEHPPSTLSSSLPALCQVGFQTAGGKDIKISELALQKAKLVIGENDENPVDHSFDSGSDAHFSASRQDSVSVGFQTARGNKVHVSRSALRRAKQILESDIEDIRECSPRVSPMLHPNTSDSDTSQNATCKMDNNHKTVQSEQVPQKCSSVTSTGLFPKTVGFQTASGNSVTVSEDSLCRARQLFAECDAVSGTSSNTESGLKAARSPKALGFQTASGSKINISDDALQKARRLISHESFEEEEAIGNATKGSISNPIPTIVGFKTASENCVEISEESLLKARQFMASDTDLGDRRDTAHPDNLVSGATDMNSEVPFPKERQGRSSHEDSSDNSSAQRGSVGTKNSAPGQIGFQTARGGAISVSDESLKKAKQLLENDAQDGNVQKKREMKQTGVVSSPPMTGFQTGSGKCIHISNSAILKAKQLLSNDFDEYEDLPDVEASSAPSNKHPGPVELEVSFQTGGGRRIQVLQSSLMQARHVLCDEKDANQNVLKSESSGQRKKDNSEHVDMDSDESHETDALPVQNMVQGFQTGHGKKVQVSEASLQRAKQFLADETDALPDQNIVQGFQTGHGKKVHVSEASILKAKQFLADENDGSPDQSVVLGFQTGRGKKVQVSAASLQEARHFLTDDTAPLQDQNIAVGFQTGHGKKVQISEASLLKAKQFLAHENDPSPDQSVAIGFQTGHGKKVQISEASLLKAKQFLSHENVASPDQSVAIGFQTGHGKKVLISEASLQRAKQFLADDTDEIPNKNIAVGFQTGHGEKVQISEASLQKAKQFLADDADALPVKNIAVGFQTGHGEKVQISEASLQKAKQFLADDTDALPVKNIAVGFQTGHGKKVHISEASLLKAKQFLANDTEPLPDQSVAIGFQTGHGKKVPISEESLQKAKQFLADDPDALPDKRIAVGFQTGHGKKVPISEESLQKAKQFLADDTDALPDKNIAVGFQTGHGKKVQISEASLLKAKQFLANDTEPLPDQSVAIGFQTGQGKKVQISEASLLKAKQSLANDTEPLPDKNIAVGFQTGHGKKVQISEASLQIAKQLLAHEKDAGTDALSKNSAVPGEANENPLSGKPSKMSGFMTGEGRKIQVSEASLQQARNSLGSQAIRNDIGGELSNGTLPHGEQQPTLASRDDGDHSTHQRRDLKEEHHQQERIRKSSRGDGSLATPSNLPAPGGLAKKSMVDTRNRQRNQQRNKGTGSRGTGQKPYKPPRRVDDKGSTSAKGLIPKSSNQTVVLNDRTNQCKALQSSPPTSPSTSSHSVSDGSLHPADPFVKSYPDQCATNQSQSQLEATPTIVEGVCSFVARWAEARRAQQQRIDAKRKKVIKPELGSLWRSRKEQDRISLGEFVNHQYPCSMSDSELFGHGILSSTLSVRPSNAEGYEFAGEDHFSPSCLESDKGIPLDDAGRLVLSPNGLAGKKEFHSALLDTPGVDPKLLKEEWVFNHYKWIIWKAATMEVAYPLQLGGRFLTPNWVLLQLKYRYDREIDHSQRPALRKILERDDAASRRMVLCVAAIGNPGSSAGHDGKGAEQRKSLQAVSHPTLELTDGWYSIPAAIDPPLANHVRSGRIVCGTKLCISGAELVGAQDACSPLEIPEGLKLKITANSTRRARYDARLGLQADPRPFPLPMTSLHPEGGTIGCLDVLILRTYPMQFMEKLPEGGSVFRNAKEEAKAAALHASRKQNKMEQLFTQIQKQFEAKQATKGQGGKRRRSLPSSRSRNPVEVEKLQSGEELFEAMEAAIDPAAFESVLSERQCSTLHAYRRLQNEVKQADLQAAFNRSLAQQNKEGKFERTVVPLMKVRVGDYNASTSKGQQTTFLTLWRPPDDLVTELVEGKRFRISSVATSAGRNMPGMCPVQLASTRATRYEELPAASLKLQRSYIPRAAASMQWLGRGYTQAAYGELDAVGIVVSLDEPSRSHPGSSQYHAVYLADQDAAVMVIKFWTSPSALNLDDMLKPGSFISVSNLQYRSLSSTLSAVALPTATASDYTVFTPNPKAGYLQAALSQLRGAIKDVPKCLELMQRKVQQLKDAPSQPAYPGSTPRNHPYTAGRERVTTPLAGLSRARSGIQSSPPTSVTSQGQPYQLMTVRSCPKNFPKTSQPTRDENLNPRIQVAGSTPSHSHPGTSRVSTNPTPRTPCQSQVSAISGVDVSPRVLAQHVELERRSQLLSRIPSPPPLSPLPYPAASPALKRGFKIPSPLVRGSQKPDPEKSLRKRLRDELEEQDDKDSEQQSKQQSDIGFDEGENTYKKQKTDNHVDTPNQKEVKSSSDNQSNLDDKIKEYEDRCEDDFGDDLGLSASGLKELEMSWSQSEPLPEPAARDQTLKMNTCQAEEGCPSRSNDILDKDKDALPTDMSLEKDNHRISGLKDEKHVASGIEKAVEGTVQACKDVVSGYETECDVVPCTEPVQPEQLADHTGVNRDDPTHPTTNNYNVTMTNASETTSMCKVEDSSALILPPHCETIGENVEANGAGIMENVKQVTDIPDQVSANLNDLESVKETLAAENHRNSEGSASSNQTKDATKEDNSQGSNFSQQSRGNDSSQNSVPVDGSQDSSKQDKSSGPSSPKSNKRKCLSLQRKKALPEEAGAVIEILEDDNPPLLKRSSRLRLQQKKSYKF
ncbi:uncharacterized protein LOC584780 [Strongylocentrotus purpuratus]|uniref:Tower domain-containing protein n=1 Tax=Strongylocentrotus purpuratus TaxID=7668 RepID=A0A7M7NI47_STRPU|nr:uncharacterized protein LOC584780 [Strongylocentrotus purpuratus]